MRNPDYSLLTGLRVAMTNAFETDDDYSCRLLIANEWRDGEEGGWCDIVNPATEQTIGRVAVATEADLDAALQAAQHGFEQWRDRPANERAVVLHAAAVILRRRADADATRLTREQGKPIAEARIEMLMCADTLAWCAEEAKRAYGRLIPARSNSVHQSVVREPIGPVAAFTPWNFPGNQAARKIGAAIASGCSIILKGPEEAPSPCIALAEALIEAGLPAGVLNLVFGVPSMITEYLIPHPVIRKISFTGSVPVGKQLAKLAGEYMKPCTMELGGHAPVVIFDDTDVDDVVRKIAAGKFRNAGQVCISPTRFYVQKKSYRHVLDAFVSAARSIKVGNGLAPDTTMGPLANMRRRDAIETLVRDAAAAGADIVTGGHRIGNTGYFYEPTVLADIPATARILRDEPFGPVALFGSFEDDDEALTKANDTAFGLAAYGFTSSAARASRLSRQFQSGMVSINHFGLGLPETPFGGIKDSGYGREGGSESLDAYLINKFISHAFT